MDVKYQMLANFFNAPLVEIAEKFHYSEENLTVLSGDKATFYAKYPRTVKWLTEDGSYRADKRDTFEFATNLVRSWLLEDYLALKLSTLGFRTNFNGSDKNRRLECQGGVKADPDLKMFIDGVWRNVEVVADYSESWKKYGTLTLRDKKYPKLLKSNSMLLAIDIKNKSFALIPINLTTKVRYIDKFFGFGGKPAYQMDISEVVFSPLDTEISGMGTFTFTPPHVATSKVTERLTPQNTSVPKKMKCVMSTELVKLSLF